jgi:hypothetical protein
MKADAHGRMYQLKSYRGMISIHHIQKTKIIYNIVAKKSIELIQKQGTLK